MNQEVLKHLASMRHSPIRNYINWSVEQCSDSRHRVIGLHSDGKCEVYQFATREWALMCKRSMERLSPTRHGEFYVACDGSALTGSNYIMTPEAMIKSMMDQLTPAKLLSMWTAPLRAKAKTAFRKLMWGEQA